MSFLKKHWKFILPAAVVVLCLVVASSLVLYGSNETQEPKTVYAIPTRTPDRLPINTGELTTAKIDVEHKQLVEEDPISASSDVAPSDQITEGDAASCCPEEELLPADPDAENLLLGLTEADIAGYEAAERDAAWDKAEERYWAEYETITERYDTLNRERWDLIDWDALRNGDYSKFLETSDGKRVSEISSELLKITERQGELLKLMELPADYANH